MKNPSNKITTLESLRGFLGIQAGVSEWDSIAIPYGVGDDWDDSYGWATVLIENGDPICERTVFHGGANIGNRSTASLMSVLHPITYITNKIGVSSAGGYKLHIVTSSKYLHKGLEINNPVWHSRMNKNRELWMAIYAAKRRGVVIKPHLVPTGRVALRDLMSELAHKNKTLMGVPEDTIENVYDINPQANI